MNEVLNKWLMKTVSAKGRGLCSDVQDLETWLELRFLNQMLILEAYVLCLYCVFGLRTLLGYNHYV